MFLRYAFVASFRKKYIPRYILVYNSIVPVETTTPNSAASIKYCQADYGGKVITVQNECKPGGTRAKQCSL